MRQTTANDVYTIQGRVVSRGKSVNEIIYQGTTIRLRTTAPGAPAGMHRWLGGLLAGYRTYNVLVSSRSIKRYRGYIVMNMPPHA